VRAKLIEKFSGSVKSSEVLSPFTGKPGPVGILLRPVSPWETELIVGKVVRLIFPNGDSHVSRIRGGGIMTKDPAMLIEFMPGIHNIVPLGTKVFLLDA
jgi:hypothetical protein